MRQQKKFIELTLIINWNYEKGNLEIHSSDYCSGTDRNSYNSRCDKLFGVLNAKKALAVIARAFFLVRFGLMV